MHQNNLRFNFGYLIESPSGVNSHIEFNYPHIQVEDVFFKPLKGEFTATRTGEGIYITGDFHTTLTTECVRCLTPFDATLHAHADEMFYYPPYIAPIGEFVIYDDGNVDLGPLVRESTLLALPMQPICQPACRGLCQECGHNLNEGVCACEIDDIDPRLAALKTLLEQQNQ